jgi:hypothetical protein
MFPLARCKSLKLGCVDYSMTLIFMQHLTQRAEWTGGFILELAQRSNHRSHSSGRSGRPRLNPGRSVLTGSPISLTNQASPSLPDSAPGFLLPPDSPLPPLRFLTSGVCTPHHKLQDSRSVSQQQRVFAGTIKDPAAIAARSHTACCGV